jgi:hypothetical protein
LVVGRRSASATRLFFTSVLPRDRLVRTVIFDTNSLVAL